MEKEKKGKKVLEIILIVLVALCFVLIPFLNQCRQKTISLNHTQLVNRQNARNGTIDIETFEYGKVQTITCDFVNILDYNYKYTQQDIDDGVSLTGSNDVMGYGFDNYFRFLRMPEYNTPNTSFIYALEYYLVFNNNVSKSYKLGYFDIVEDNDEAGNFIRYSPITKQEFNLAGILPVYNSLNFNFYNSVSFDNLMNLYLSNDVFGLLINIESNYKVSSNFETFIYSPKTYFVDFNKDTITSLISTIKNDSYLDGYYYGYEQGQSSNTTSVFSLLSKAASSISAFLNIEVLPNISMWLLISIPLSISIMIILLRLLRGGN